MPLASERLFVRPEIDLVRPGTVVLAMKMPVAVGDRLDVQKTVGAGLFLAIGHARQQALALDAAVDDDMRDVDALRTKLARHRLDQQPQAALGGIERRESRPASQRSPTRR